jgi:hypothetical protein
MTYTFKLAKRMAIIWLQVSAVLRFASCCLVALVSWYKNLERHRGLQLALGLFSVLTGEVTVRRIVLQETDRRRVCNRRNPGRRVGDRHPVQEFRHPWRPLVWQFVFVGIVRVAGD